MRNNAFLYAFTALILSSLSLACGDSTLDDLLQDKAQVRVIHLSYDGPSVDIYANDAKAITDLPFTRASEYVEVDANKEIKFKVTETGKTDAALPESTQTLEKDKSYTVLAIGKIADQKALAVLSDDNAAPAQGKAKIRVFHGAPDAPTVEIKSEKADGTQLFKVAFGEGSAYQEVDAGDVKIVLTAEGSTEALASYQAITLEAGKIYTIVAHGTFDSSDQVDFGLRAFIDNGEGKGKDFADLVPEGTTTQNEAKARVLHMSYDGPAVDVFVNDAQDPAIKTLAYGESSGYATIPSGKPSIKVTETGKSTPALINASPEIEKDGNYTIVAYDAAASIKALVLPKDNLTPAQGKAKIRVVHAAKAPAVDIKANDPTAQPLFQNLSEGQASEYQQVDPGKVSIVITATGDDTAVIKFQEIELQAGQIYTVVARGTLEPSDSYDFGVRVFVDLANEGKDFVDLQPEAANNDTANVRVIHASYDAPGVDITIGDATEPAIKDLKYGISSGYAALPTGNVKVKVTETGKQSPALLNPEITLEKDKHYTVIAYDKAASITALFEEDDRVPAQGKAKIRVIHAADAPNVDIKLDKPDSTPVFPDLAKGKATKYTEVDPGKFVFVITAAGNTTDAVVKFQEVTLEADTAYTVVAHGTLDANDNFPFAVRVFIDNDKGDQFLDLKADLGTANVRVIHASYDGPGVDVTIGNAQSPAITDLKYSISAGYASLPAGKVKVTVTETGKQSPALLNPELDLEKDKNYTVIAYDAAASIKAIFTPDDRVPTSGKVKIRVIHAADAPNVDIKVGTPTSAPVFPDVGKGKATSYIEVDPGPYTFVITPAGGNASLATFKEVTLTADTAYTVVAHGTFDQNDNFPFAVRVFIDNGDGKQFVDLTPAP